MRNLFLYTFALFIFIQCAPSRFVEPLQKKEHAITANFGGPMVVIGAPIPLPLSAIGYGYGIDTNWTLFGSIHTTSLLYGNLQTDFGTTYGIYNSKTAYIPSFSASANGNVVWDLADKVVKFWPQIDANVYWHYTSKKHYAYIGTSNWFELEKYRSQDRKSISPWIFNAQIGTVLKHKTYQFQMEYKWLAPNRYSENAFLPYVTIGGYGASGLYFGVSKTF